ncbi:MAG: hypothetical protein OEM77_03280 [Nitrosopumilus sp.]|nr:hypothetical protein [Nitrosopumilus sp.]MDH3736618.1 hypothetical protein [Nitrosopumilus sp.]MDH3823313.1 hypothetical protein [Nitrosopumilus sp.]MDH3833525.1 hypothetical protein [Nitrosopumilus sp.]
MSFEESFLYPLGLLAIGSVVSMFLVPRFSDRYNKKRHELEIKKDLIVKITELDAEWHIVLGDMDYPVEDNTENARILAKQVGELEKRESVVQSVESVYFKQSSEARMKLYKQMEPFLTISNFTRVEKTMDELQNQVRSLTMELEKVKQWREIAIKYSK